MTLRKENYSVGSFSAQLLPFLTLAEKEKGPLGGRERLRISFSFLIKL